MLSREALRVAAVGFAVVDVETTGCSSRRHRIVELAVVQLDRQRRVQGEFATLVDPEGPVGPTHIHGIEARDLGPAPCFRQVAERLTALLRGRVLVGHNVGCDRAFLAAEYARLGVELPPVPQVCTMRLAERYFSSPQGLSLRACAAAAGVRGWAEHTALGDARAAGELFVRCAERATARRAESAGSAAGARGAADAVAGCAEGLALAAALEWPGMPRAAQARGAAWVGRTRGRRVREGNEARRPMVSARPQGGA